MGGHGKVKMETSVREQQLKKNLEKKQKKKCSYFRVFQSKMNKTLNFAPPPY